MRFEVRFYYDITSIVLRIVALSRRDQNLVLRHAWVHSGPLFF